MNNILLLLIGLLVPNSFEPISHPAKSGSCHDVVQDSTIIHSFWDKCRGEYALEDSNQLTHVTGVFYRSANGHLYERTVSLKPRDGILVSTEYFNGRFSQEVDPYTFHALDGWYAVDKNNVYYSRPVSGGIWISKVEEADVKTFRILNGHYAFGMDANFFFDGGHIIEGFTVSDTKMIKDKNGKVIRLVSKKTKLELELEP